MKHSSLVRGIRRSLTAAAALAAIALGSTVAADEVTAPVEVDPFFVVAMDAVESEVVGDVEVTNSTATTIVDGAEDVVTTVEYSPVFTEAPVEVDAYIPLTEEPVVPATEIPVVVDGVEETPETPEAPVEAPVEVDPIIPLEEEPVVDPADEPVTEVPNEAPKHELPEAEVPVITEIPNEAPKHELPEAEVPVVPAPEAPLVTEVPNEAPKHEIPALEIPVIEEPTIPTTPVVEEPVVPSVPVTEEPVVPSVPVVAEPVVPATPATEAPVAPAAIRIPFTGAVLPNTGETSSFMAVLGFIVLAAAAVVATRKRA